MPVTAVNRLVGSSTTTATSYTTASWTPVANRLYVPHIVSTIGSGAPPTPSLSGNGMTWVLVTNTSDNLRNIWAFRAMGSAPTTGVLTITVASPNSCQWIVDEFDGVDTSGTNGSGAVVQSVAATVGTVSNSFSATLPSAVTAGNATTASLSIQVAEAITPRAGWTELADDTETAPNTGLESQWRADGEQTASGSWTTNAACRLIALEVKAAAAATFRAPRPLISTCAPIRASTR